MQVIDNGETRELESYELEALQSAWDAHEAEQNARGVFTQYEHDKAISELLAEVVNQIEVPVEKAVKMRDLFPEWSDDCDYSEGFKVNYADSLWSCITAHHSQSDWSPFDAPSLWAKVLIMVDPDSGEPILSEWEQPSSTNPYNQGDRVTHNGKTWVSVIANNVWEPGVYGWEEVVS